MGNRLSDRIAAIAPSATLAVDAKAKALQAAGRPVISYAAGEPDFCYYRVYRISTSGSTLETQHQIASTIATSHTDTEAAVGAPCEYRVIAVDQSGNASR